MERERAPRRQGAHSRSQRQAARLGQDGPFERLSAKGGERRYGDGAERAVRPLEVEDGRRPISDALAERIAAIEADFDGARRIAVEMRANGRERERLQPGLTRGARQGVEQGGELWFEFPPSPAELSGIADGDIRHSRGHQRAEERGVEMRLLNIPPATGDRGRPRRLAISRAADHMRNWSCRPGRASSGAPSACAGDGERTRGSGACPRLKTLSPSTVVCRTFLERLSARGRQKATSNGTSTNPTPDRASLCHRSQSSCVFRSGSNPDGAATRSRRTRMLWIASLPSAQRKANGSERSPGASRRRRPFGRTQTARPTITPAVT